MARTSHSLFEEASDVDSINTTTTVESAWDSEKQFDIEKVLLEERDVRNGKLTYLIKWEGYPLAQATWEPKDEQVQLVVDEWEHEKKLIAGGQATAFTFEEYNQAVEDAAALREDKQRRRKAKRRKRGIASSKDVSADDDESRLTMKRVKTSPVKRKGIAQVVTNHNRKRSLVLSDGDDDDEAEPEEEVKEASLDSLFGEPKQANAPAPAPKIKQVESFTTTSKHKKTAPSAGTIAPTSAATISIPHAGSRKPSGATAIGPKRSLSTTKEAAAGPARKSAPSVLVPKQALASANSGSKVFGGDWAAPKKRKERARVSGETPKDSDEPKFRNLATQNRYQKYSVNEPAPDLNALNIVDARTGRVQQAAVPASTNAQVPRPRVEQVERPKTGRTQTAPAAASAKAQPTEIHSVYGRRSPPLIASRAGVTKASDVSDIPVAYARRSPPLDTRQRSLSPSRVRHSAQLDVQTGVISDTSRIGTDTTELTPVLRQPDLTILEQRPVQGEAGAAGPPPRTPVTCWRWLSDDCESSAETCRFAHWDTGQYSGPPVSRGATYALRPSDLLTCWFYYTFGTCNKGSSCAYAHWNTGIVATKPGTLMWSAAKQSNRVGFGKRPDARETARQQNPTADVATSFPAASLDTQRPHQGTPRAGESLGKAAALVDDRPTNIESAAPPTATTSSLLLRDSLMTEFDTAENPDPRRRGRSTPLRPTAETASIESHPSASSAQPAEAMHETSEATSIETSLRAEIRTDVELAKKSLDSIDRNKLLVIDTGLIRDVCIHMPSSRAGEMRLLYEFFKKFNCKVFRSHSREQWELFRDAHKKTTTLLILHPDESFIETLPGLHSFIVDHGSNARVFSIGVQRLMCLDEAREPAYEAQRLFPHGGMTFISDDVFVYYPEKATEIIDKFLKATAPKPPGAELSKIGARPGIRKWLLDIDRKKYEEQIAVGEFTDHRWLKLFDAIDRLCPPEDEDPWNRAHHVPLEKSHLWSDPEDWLPNFQGRWERGDEEGATDFMMQHFAGEASMQASRYRRFLFVYARPNEDTRKKAEAWMAKYCHVGVVTPEQLLKKK